MCKWAVSGLEKAAYPTPPNWPLWPGNLVVLQSPQDPSPRGGHLRLPGTQSIFAASLLPWLLAVCLQMPVHGIYLRPCVCMRDSNWKRDEYEKTNQPTNWGHSNSLWKPQLEGYTLCPTLCSTGPPICQPAGLSVALSLFNFLTSLSLLYLQRDGNKTLCSCVSGSCRGKFFVHLRPKGAPALIGQARLWPSAPLSMCLRSWLPASSCLCLKLSL